MRAAPLVAGAFLGAVCWAPAASAQLPAQGPGIAWRGDLAMAGTVPVAERRPSRTRYVLTGAAVGAGVTALALYLYFEESDVECMCHPLMFTPVVLGGGAVGALGGLVVHGVVATGADRRLMVGFNVAR